MINRRTIHLSIGKSCACGYKKAHIIRTDDPLQVTCISCQNSKIYEHFALGWKKGRAELRRRLHQTLNHRVGPEPIQG